MTPLDCGDNGCYFATDKGGMRTNGGCRCLSNAGFHKSIYAATRDMLLEVLKLREQLAEIFSEAERAEDAQDFIRWVLEKAQANK